MNDQACCGQEPPVLNAMGQLNSAIDRLNASISDLHGRLDGCSSPVVPEVASPQTPRTDLAGESSITLALRDRVREINNLHEGVLARLRRLEIG